MINRTIAPAIHPISNIVIPQIHKTQFTNGLVVYYLPIANTNIVDFNLQFKAGTICHSNILVPTYANRQLQEGTTTKTAHQIADMFDFFGASMRSAASYDDAHIGFASLRKHTDSLLNLVFEMITQPLFGENELRVNLLRGKENLKQQLQKPEYLSRLLFRENLFGKHHPYGKQAIETHYDTLLIADLKTFHAQYYSPNNAFLFVSGNVDELLIKQLEKIFGSNDWKQTTPPLTITNNIETTSLKKIHQPREGVQSSIRIGKLTVDRKHPDANKLRVMNTILGGYFGSRLMMNIREDKGYTYGINSGLQFQQLGSSFMIKTEVGKDVCADALKEIYTEIDILKNEKVEVDELEKVKNYMLGSYLEDLGNIFELSTLYMSYITMGRTVEDYYESLESIKTTTVDDVLLLAQKHLNVDEMIEVVVG